MMALVLILAISWPFRCATCDRDDTGRIKRSVKVRKAFERANPKPANGWVVDHIVPLACADVEDLPLDDIRNLQWQSPAASRAKDRWEVLLCDPLGRTKIAAKHKQRIPEYLR